jgi:hypothetical protein
LLGDRQDRNFDREASCLPHTPLNFLRAGSEMCMAGAEIRPRVKDADDRLPGIVVMREADLRHTRSMAESAQIIDS